MWIYIFSPSKSGFSLICSPQPHEDIHILKLFFKFFSELPKYFFKIRVVLGKKASNVRSRGYGEKREIFPNLQDQFGDATSGAPLDIPEWSEMCYRSRKWNLSRFWDVLSPWSAKMVDFSCRSGKISLFKSIGFSIFFPKTTRISKKYFGSSLFSVMC